MRSSHGKSPPFAGALEASREPRGCALASCVVALSGAGRPLRCRPFSPTLTCPCSTRRPMQHEAPSRVRTGENTIGSIGSEKFSHRGKGGAGRAAAHLRPRCQGWRRPRPRHNLALELPEVGHGKDTGTHGSVGLAPPGAFLFLSHSTVRLGPRLRKLSDRTREGRAPDAAHAVSKRMRLCRARSTIGHGRTLPTAPARNCLRHIPLWSWASRRTGDSA